MAPNKDLRSLELSSQLFHIIGRSFMTVEAWRLRRNLRSVLICRMNVQTLKMCLEIAYRPTKAHEVRTNNAEAQFQQHWNLVSPAHRKIRPAMKLHESVKTIHNCNNNIADVST